MLLERLAAAGALEGALVTIDAIACNPTIADAITGNGADFVLAVKENQPSLRGEIAAFSTPRRPRASRSTSTSTRTMAASRRTGASSRRTSPG